MSGLDLFLSQSVFLRMLLWAALCGVALGVVYDAILLLRLMLDDPDCRDIRRIGTASPPRASHSPPIIALYKLLRFGTDLIFAILCAVSLILLCYYTNDGQIRAPAILGVACGFFVYMSTLSRPLCRLAAHLIRTFLLIPARFLVKCLGALIGYLWRGTIGRLVARRRVALTEKRLHTLQKAAEEGFPPYE